MSHSIHDSHHHSDADITDIFGFWLYILTDVILFASLFATFLVLNTPESFGPKLKEFINLEYILVSTFLLLFSNFTFGLAGLALKDNDIPRANRWLGATFILGATFVGMEGYEFYELVHQGYGWYVSGAASSFFALVGTHGLHVSVGLLWIAVIISQLLKFGYAPVMQKRFIYLGIFWNFLDVIWIFVFSIVYLLGAV